VARCSTADLCQRWVDKLQLPKNAAFDVGCAVGRTSFDLSKSFKSVLGLDFSHKFIDTANKLKSGTEIEYSTVTEGDGRTTYTCAAPKDARPERITFIQGDACNLPAGIGPFSVIQGSNLLCRCVVCV
jgi:protein-L-isoaspartate O-methyltransferase